MIALSISIRYMYICTLLVFCCYRHSFQKVPWVWNLGTYFYVFVSQEIQIMNISDGWNQNCTVCTRSVTSPNTTVCFVSCKMLTHILISNHMFNLLLLCSSSCFFPVLTTKFSWVCSNLSSGKPRDSDTPRQLVSLSFQFLCWWIAVL